MKITEKCNTAGVKVFLFIALLVIVACGAWVLSYVQYVNASHASFDSYYRFRGCQQLVEKTDTYGICRLSSGATIKIVEYQGRWFLDGDLPGVW